MSNLQKEHEWNPEYPAQEMHIKFLKEVIKTQKEQIDELNNSLEMYRFLESGEEEHEQDDQKILCNE